MKNLQLGRLEVSLTPGAITLRGRIDDAAPISSLVDECAPGTPVTIDTDGVTFVNSIGVCEWMRLLRGLVAKGCRLTLVRVADVLMTQMNMIPDAKQSANVASFHAQYVCNACGAEAAPVVDAVAHQEALAQLQAPSLPCPEPYEFSTATESTKYA